MKTPAPNLKRYLVKVEGFEPYEYVARSASAARYACFRAARDVGYFSDESGFKRFLALAYVKHMGPALSNPPEKKDAADGQ